MSQSGIPLPAALDLRGRRALVTGAASGIGRATATWYWPSSARNCCSPIVRRSPRSARRFERIGATCTTAEGDLASDTFIAALFAGERVHAACALRGDPGRVAIVPRPQLA